jgi:SAM-dependent methyltransferase
MMRLYRRVLAQHSRLASSRIVRRIEIVGMRALTHGTSHQCPICERAFLRYVPRGPNLMCPHCLSFERHRLMWLYLRTLIKPGSSLLHLAPEPALVPRLRRRLGSAYVTGDISSGPLVDVVLDAHSLPFDDQCFDFIVCSHVFEHLKNDRRAAQQCARTLRSPDGRLLLQVPVDDRLATTYEDDSLVTPRQRLEAFGQYDHVRVYGRDVPDRLAGGGLDVAAVVSLDTYPSADRSRWGLYEGPPRRGTDIYVCRPIGAQPLSLATSRLADRN